MPSHAGGFKSRNRSVVRANLRAARRDNEEFGAEPGLTSLSGEGLHGALSEQARANRAGATTTATVGTSVGRVGRRYSAREAADEFYEFGHELSPKSGSARAKTLPRKAESKPGRKDS